MTALSPPLAVLSPPFSPPDSTEYRAPPSALPLAYRRLAGLFSAVFFSKPRRFLLQSTPFPVTNYAFSCHELWRFTHRTVTFSTLKHSVSHPKTSYSFPRNALSILAAWGGNRCGKGCFRIFFRTFAARLYGDRLVCRIGLTCKRRCLPGLEQSFYCTDYE